MTVRLQMVWDRWVNFSKERLAHWFQTIRRRTLAKLEALQARGKDKKPRQMHPNSLANLCPAPRFSTANRPCRRSKLTEAQLNEAIKLRESGLPWRMLGDRYGVSHDTLRLAVRDKGTKCHIGR